MTRILLSGSENIEDYDIVAETGHNNILFNYLHLRKFTKTNWLKKRKEDNPDAWIFIDSGGFGLRSDPDLCMRKYKITVEEYADQYVEWLYKHAKWINGAANLDLYEDYPDLAERIDSELQEFERATGINICYVYQECLGDGSWEHMCQRHHYVGVNWSVAKSRNIEQMLMTARRYGTLVHGFAITNSDAVGRLPFFSVDSTTWISGGKFGRTQIFTGSEFRHLDEDQKHRRTAYKNHFMDRGIDWDLIEADTAGHRSKTIRAEVLKMNAISWKEYADHLTTIMKQRNWWSRLPEALVNLPEIDQASADELVAWIDADTSEPGILDGMQRTLEMREVVRLMVACATLDPKVMWAADSGTLDHLSSKLLDPSKVIGTHGSREKLFSLLRPACIQCFVDMFSQQEQRRGGEEAWMPTQDRPEVRGAEEMSVMDDNISDDNEVELPSPLQDGSGNDYNEIDDTNIEQSADGAQATVTNSAQTRPQIEFLDDIDDETLRLRVEMLVDTKKRVVNLNRLKARSRMSRGVNKADTKALAAELKCAKEELAWLQKRVPKDIRDQVDEWVEETMDAPPQEQKPQTEERQYNITSKNASEIGKLGGAPKGNRNALRHGMYSKKMPGIACDRCSIQGDCYMYRPGAACAFDKEIQKLKLRDLDDVKDALSAIAETNLDRAQRQILIEKVNGGQANPETSKLLEQTFRQTDRVREVLEVESERENAAAGITQGDVTMTQTVSGPGAVLAQLFQQAMPQGGQGSMAADQEAERTAIEVTPVTEDEGS